MNDDFNKLSKKISKKIKLERVNKGLSQEDLALAAGLNRNTISKIETGQVSPTIETLEKIAYALGMDFATLTNVSHVEI